MNHARGFAAGAGRRMALACALSALSCSERDKVGGDSSTNAGVGGAGSVTAAAEQATSATSGSVLAGADVSSGSVDAGTHGPATTGASVGTGGSSSGSDADATGDPRAASASVGGGAGTAGNGGGWSEAFPTFTKHEIASFNSGYATVVADIDGDGQNDVVALSSGSDGLVWFKNPEWTRYPITRAPQLIHTAPYDVDGDGDVDLAVASDFDMNDTVAGGTVAWAEAPDDPTANEEWTLHDVGAVPTSHRVAWADIDGDGKKELIDLPIFGEGSMAPAHAGPVALTAFAMPSDPSSAWTPRVVDDTHLETAHGLCIVDWDADGADDILTAANDGVDLFRPALGTGAERLGAGAEGQAPDKGSSDVVLGRLGEARFIASIEPWHGSDAVVYTPGAAAADLWTREVLGSDFEHGHGLAAADFNGDGFDEVVGGGGQGDMREVIYRYLPSTRSWEKIELDAGSVAVSGLDVADINGDGAPDIVAIGGSPTNNLVWYENSL